MASDDKKKKGVTGGKRSHPSDAAIAQIVEKKPTGGTVSLSFYDATTLEPLSPPANDTQIELLSSDGTVVGSVPLQQNEKSKEYFIDVPPLPAESDPSLLSQETKSLENLCDIPDAAPMLVMHGFTSSVSVGCHPYQMMRTATDYPTGDLAGDLTPDEMACSRVPVGLTMVEVSCTFSLVAHDNCIGDYIAHPGALLDDVRLELREVEGPKQTSGAKTTNTFRGRRFSAVTKGGYLEIPGLAFGQLYEALVTAPPGYVCTNPPPQRIVINRGQNLRWTAAFQPCGAFPTRSVIFVQKAYPGMRMTNLQLEGQQTQPDRNGVWNLPQPTGRVDFQSAGNVFSPPYINLDKDSPMVFVVGVGDEQVAQLSPGKRRFQHVDHKGEPFANRQLRLVSPGGHEEFVRTDPRGWFEAEEGSSASAADDDIGYASDFPCLTIATD
jgi:hypothetical protein